MSTLDKPRRGRPSTGKALSAAERMRRLRARRKTAGLREVTTWTSGPQAATPYSSHRLVDARSLALHVLAAERINQDPSLLQIAHRNLERWRTRQGDAPPAWLKEWTQILQRPWPEVAGLISEMSENAARLRQSSPFAGVLKPEERRRVYEAFRT